MSAPIVILHYAGPPTIGGVELTIYHHARWLAEHNYPVHVVVGQGEPFHPGVKVSVIPEIHSRHPDVLTITKALAEGHIPSAFYTLRTHLRERLRPVLQEAQAVIVHNAMTLHKNMALTAALYDLAQQGLTRFIAWAHDFAWRDELYIPEMHPGYPWDLLRTPWPHVMYVVVSQHRRQLLAELLGIPGPSIHVVPPGVDVSQFLKLEKETQRLVERLDLLAAAPLILLPARITRRKNIEFAIEIMGALVPEMPKARLIVTGPPGPHNPSNIAYLNALRERRAQRGLEHHVHFLYEYGEGDTPLHVTDAMMSDLYQLADILLFPSKREGFGIPVLEAGLTRLLIFASDIPPVRESAGPWAIRFALDAPPHLVARQITEHVNASPIYRMRKRVLTNYTWDSIMERRVLPLIQNSRAQEELK